MVTRSDNGSILVMVLLFTAILLTLTMSLAYLGRTNNRMATLRLQEEQAFYLAEAGLAAAEARLRVNPDLSSGFTGNLGVGAFRVTIGSEERSGSRRRLQIIASGESGSARKTLTGIFLVEPYPHHPVWSYTLYSSEDIYLGNITVEGNIFCNGNVIITGPCQVDGNIQAAGEAMVEEGIGAIEISPDQEPLFQPNLNIDFYRRMSVQNLPDGILIEGSNTPVGVTFVEGNATVSGTFPAGSAVVATGSISINPGTQTEGEGLLLIAAGESINVTSGCNLRCVLYATGSVNFIGSTSLSGVAAGGRIVLQGPAEFVYVEPTASVTELTIPLPGLNVSRETWYENATTIRSS
ncbi:MAG: hypothetical protein ACOX2S_03940 [bacterium]